MIGLLLMLALECPATVVGSVEIYLTVHYLHEAPQGLHYVLTLPTQIATDEVLMVPWVEGTPVGFRWWARPYGEVTKSTLEMVKECGLIPTQPYPLIFADGFEGGTTSAWSRVVPAPLATPTPTRTPTKTSTPTLTPTSTNTPTRTPTMTPTYVFIPECCVWVCNFGSPQQCADCIEEGCDE